MALAERVKEAPKLHPYGVGKDTTLWSGANDPHWVGKAPKGMFVWTTGPPTRRRGVDYYYCLVESPPEMKGEHVWLAKLPKQPGWIS